MSKRANPYHLACAWTVVGISLQRLAGLPDTTPVPTLVRLAALKAARPRGLP